MHDIHNDIEVRTAVSARQVSDNTAAVGSIIDLADCLACEFIITTGTLADADMTLTALLEHSDASNMSGAVAVPDSDLIGTEALASFTFANDNTTKKLGYKGIKRYVRLTLTPANNASAADFAAVVVLKKRVNPVA